MSKTKFVLKGMIDLMSLLKLFFLAVGLSMDAFGVSVCKGLSCKKLTIKRCLIVGAWFGVFQALMPLIGYFLGTQLESYITAIDHWIAFGLLLLIGVNMIRAAALSFSSIRYDSHIFRTASRTTFSSSQIFK